MSHPHRSHDHSHAQGTPHPAQAMRLSLLRMAMPARLGVAVLIAAGLWSLVLLAMR